MANLPTALERREFLYGRPKKTPDFAALGKGYEDAGIYNDAIECYEKIADETLRKQKLSGVRATAIKEGIHFLLNRLDNSLPLSMDEWHEAAVKAKQLGKLQYAYKSAQRTEDAKLIDELREALGIPKPGEPQPGEEGFVDYLQSGEGEVPAEEGAEAEASKEDEAVG